MIKGCPVAILVASVEHPSQLLRLPPHLTLSLPTTSGCSLASDSWLSIPQVIMLFIRLICAVMAYITKQNLCLIVIVCCLNLMSTDPQQGHSLAPWIQPASE